MLFKKSPTQLALTALLAAALLACSEKPDAMLSSAKDYLAKNDSKAAVIQIKNALQSNPDLPEARFMLGTALLESGDAAGAETELRKALTLKHPQDQVIPPLAKAMLAQGQARKLTDELAITALGTPATQANFLTTMATAYAMQSKPELAQGALNAALAADPTYAPAQIMLARRKAGQNDIASALATLEEVIAKNPRNHDAWKLKGDILLYAKNQQPDALAAYHKAVEAKPDFLAGQSAVIHLLLQQARLTEAATQIEQLKKISPHHPQTKYLEALLAFQNKAFTPARDLVQQALKSAPDNTQALQLAGAVALQLKSLVQAEAYFSKALQAAPHLALARRALVMIYLRTGQPAKALATLTPGLNHDHVDPALLAMAGQVYLQNNDLKAAEEFFAKASQQDPTNAKNLTSLALTRVMGGQVDAGLNTLHDIAASDNGTTADMALISVHLRRLEYDKALAAIDALDKKQPGQAMTANLRGRTLLAKKDVAGARHSFELALRLDASFFPAAAGLASLDMADKKPEDAKKRFLAVLAKDAKNSQALLALAELAARTGAAHDEVVKLIGNAITAHPTDATPRVWLIDFHLRNKDVKLASSVAQDATAALPESPDVLDALGRTQLAAGELNQAIASYNKLAGLQAFSPLPHMRLADVHLANKNKEAAAQSLRKALQIKPDLQQAQRGSILLDLDSKNVAGALATARNMQKQNPNEATGHVLEGDIHATQKSWDSAATAYREGLKMATTTELAVKLHATLLAAGKTTEADKFSASWQQNHAKDATFALYLGDGALARKDYAAAEKLYASVIKRQANNAIAYNNLAWVSAKLNKDGALALAEKANALAPNQPAFMDTLAMLLSQQGAHTKAAELQTKALALQPQNLVFKLNLAKIHLQAGQKDRAKKDLDELAQLGDKFDGQAEVAELLKGL